MANSTTSNIDEIYKLRKDFTIIGTTGRMGSGCSDFSNMITNRIDFTSNKYIRTPKELFSEDSTNSDSEIFKRKYRICYEYMKTHNQPFKRIPYHSVLLFISITKLFENKNFNSNNIADKLKELIDEFYQPEENKKDYVYKEIAVDNIKNILIRYNLNNLEDVSADNYANLDTLFNSFFEGNFEHFSEEFFRLLKSTDYYLGAMFVHWLGKSIRAKGSPFDISDQSSEGYKVFSKDVIKEVKCTDKLFTVVELINRLIKSYKGKQKERPRRFCIDSLRNSLEIMYLKERYSAFYMVAVHDDENHVANLRNRIFNTYNREENTVNEIETITESTIDLDERENEAESFNTGKFFAPDVENCIQKSEIHIHNPGCCPQYNENTFYTMQEQWIKIFSLILHPGLITPSRDERCMHLAFSLKCNSGCLSRQVGAVIADENNSIQAVGWNETPRGTIPCNQRSLCEVFNGDFNTNTHVYSKLETSSDIKPYKSDQYDSNEKISFKNMARKYNDLLPPDSGLNYSYCFKCFHNEFEGKKNQVHTRALHAEENAMLQIAKHGGQPLLNGILYTTASPCELCAKKAYQLGLSIIYIDPYPGISMKHILENGFNQPNIKMFSGVVGRSYLKLYEPFMAYKDELDLITQHSKPKEKKYKKLQQELQKLLEQEINDSFDFSALKKEIEEGIEKGIYRKKPT